MRRWYEIASLVWVGCGCLLIGCGSVEMEELEPTEFSSEENSACLNCNQDDEEEETQDLSPSAAVRAFPEELMFYGDFHDSEALESIVSVKNQTHSSVLVTAVYVVGDSSMYGADAEEYFQTNWNSDDDNLLAPGETLNIKVRFSPSQQLRSGGLFIETTHVDFGLLDVDLSGKMFADN